MSLDPRSRERLEALGRSLPQKLPAPQQAKPPLLTSPAAGRHRLETEQDPEALFRELIGASTDGTVPSHLLERLRELEAARPQESRDWTGAAGGPAARRSASDGRTTPAVGASAATGGPSRRASQTARATPPRGPRLDPEQQALYSDFDQLLREADPDD
ncbi:MAG: hypothetical protein ACK46L_12520 [Synechococcaceae cyanobacterium]|jgi:hypothetical protein